MMLENLAVKILPPVFAAFIAWFFALKKNKLDLMSNKLDNEIKSAKFYQGLLDDLSKRLDDSLTANKELQESNKALANLNRELLEELRKYKQLNGKSTN